jgi:hypothetical protein
MAIATETSVEESLDFYFERRSKPRIPVDIHARLKSLDPVTSSGPSIVARLIEISRGGLKLRVGERFLTGSSVQVVAERRIFNGKVRYCRSTGKDFHIGIQLAEV